jgi:hypothetical protein
MYVARVAGTTASGASPIREGFTSSKSRGAGIRVYEYASTDVIHQTRLQLEALIWLCFDAQAVLKRHGMTSAQIKDRESWRLSEEEATKVDLLDLTRLRHIRALNTAEHTICPLCLQEMSAQALSDKVQQAAGRERFDTRITEASLFHIAELRVGELGHRPYNLGWGHHHCNVVAKDAGVPITIEWMRDVIRRNDRFGT